MRILAWILWAVAIVWVLLALFGAEEFQEMYGGTSGAQWLLLAVPIALIPAALGWWAYRRSKA